MNKISLLPESPVGFYYEQIDKSIEQIIIDIDTLYAHAGAARDSFEAKWDGFLRSDQAYQGVIWREGNKLSYLSQAVLPWHQYDKLPLLLVFGNPAPYSIQQKTPFAFEGKGREHRLWRALQGSGLIRFDDGLGRPAQPINLARKEQLLARAYASPYTVGFIQYFSMPTTPSAPPWTGINGLFRLFGTAAMKKIECFELSRISMQVSRFMAHGGILLAFQKDAFNGLRDQASVPAYSYAHLAQGILAGRSRFGSDCPLIGAPPTRMAHSKDMKKVLTAVAAGTIL